MALIRVTASQIRSTADQLEQYNKQFRTQTTRLLYYERNLCSQWEGQARDAFHNAFNSDKEYMNQFYMLIDHYCYALEQIAQAYEQAEVRNADIAGKRSF